MAYPTFSTRQFRAGDSLAVRVPDELAFLPKTQLKIRREGNRLIVEPKDETLNGLASLFADEMSDAAWPK